MIRLSPIPAEPDRFQRAIKGAKSKVKSKVDYAADKYPESTDFEPVWSDFKYCFEVAQGGKCAFCETKIQASSYGRIDHFRPKSEVCEPISEGNRDDTKGDVPERKWAQPYRPGYWWLAYDWKNYLFICEKCNTWKGSSFPLEGGRPPASLQEGDEGSEKPLLINPYLEDPLGHLAWDETGRVKGRTDKGRMTVDRCGLDREWLRQEREQVARTLLDRFEEIMSLGEAVFFERLWELCENNEPYAGMARFLVAAKLGLEPEVWFRTAEGEA